MSVWSEVRLADRCEIFSGYAFKSSGFTDDENDVALVKGENIGQGEILWDISKRWPREHADDLARYRLETGDVVLAMDRPWVSAGLKVARIGANDPEAYLVQRVARLRARPGLDQNYLYGLVTSRPFVEYVKTIARGVGVPHISAKQIGDCVIRLPSLSVQERIAEILTAYDDLIQNNRRRMALLEEAARQLYREWFVRLRFPGHEPTRIVDGVPDGWERRTLGEVLTLKRGYDLPENDRAPGDVPVVSSSGVTGFHDAKMADAPGIVTGRYGTLGQVYFIDRDYWPLNTALYVCDRKGSSSALLLHVLRVALENRESDKAAVPGLNRNVVHALPVLWPSKRLRDRFSEFAEEVLREINVLRSTNERLHAARDLLLPRLMSGEVPV